MLYSELLIFDQYFCMLCDNFSFGLPEDFCGTNDKNSYASVHKKFSL